MVLGNVINKLSEGAKQRGHIPYCDSKLTCIIQPALGGNAKTSIICTVAPEEVHIEETKGTLQFASRAKRITNCVQVNEILTDAALLKRQKLEIEDLRNKLQGSHAEVLEQEILKLRNDMLKYELEREKLAMELEEERRSHREREQHMMEQQMKINNLSSFVPSSDCDRNSSQGNDSVGQSFKEECNGSQDVFKTPGFKAIPNAFVVRRSNYSSLSDYSPLPDTFSNVADEDTWLKMNNGFTADLDLLQMTPARKVQSFPSSDVNLGFLNENYEQEIENLKRQLELAIEEKNELKRNHTEQVQLNSQLLGEISELQQEALLIQEIPRRLCESVANCRDVYKDVMSIIQSFVVDENHSTATLLSSTSEIGTSLFSTLETHFSMAMNSHGTVTGNHSLFQEQWKGLCEKLNQTITTLVLSNAAGVEDKYLSNPLCCWTYKGEETAHWKEKLENELTALEEKYNNLEKELDANNHLLQVSKERYQTLEKEFDILKQEKDTLLQTVSDSTQKLVLLSDQNEKILKDLVSEIQRRKGLEEDIKEFSVAFSSRQRAFMSFHSEFKSDIEKLKAQNQVSLPRSLGC